MPDTFRGYSPEACQFLWELAFNNEREWFLAHKQDFEYKVNIPTKALAADCAAILRERLPALNFDCKVSRIYRDARRLFGRGPYKDHLWFTLKSGLVGKDGPAFWFEIGPKGYSYGAGFWCMSPATADAFRRKIDANPAACEALFADIEALPQYSILGEEHKKPKGHPGGISEKWYNRRELAIGCDRDFEGDILTPEFPAVLADEFMKIMPFYDLLVELYFAAPDEGRS